MIAFKKDAMRLTAQMRLTNPRLQGLTITVVHVILNFFSESDG